MDLEEIFFVCAEGPNKVGRLLRNQLGIRVDTIKLARVTADKAHKEEGLDEMKLQGSIMV